MGMRLSVLGDGAHGLAQARDGLGVALVRPPVIIAPRSLSYYGAVPDLGLAYVAAAAREVGHRVTLVDAPGLAIDRVRSLPTAVGELAAQGISHEEIVERIPPGTRAVGFTNMFLHEWEQLQKLIALVKRRFPAALTIVGGENATAYGDHMIAGCPALDVVVRGEGEAALCEILAALEDERPLDEVPGLVVRRNGEAIRTPARSRMTSLDALPWPAWDLFELSSYFDHRLASGVDRGRALPILTSRGCPYRCSFCSSPQMWGTRYVRRDPERVLDEIETYQREYGVRNVNINDLTSLLTKKWILEFCAAIKKRGLEFTWQLPSGTRSEAVDREAARAMVDAGCRNFCYAPESGSEPELKRMRKRVKLPTLLRSLQGSIDEGMVTQATIIIGMPHQELADLARSYAFMVKLARMGLHSLGVLVFAPYPGSEEFFRLEERGRIRHDAQYYYASLLRSIGSLRSYHPWLSSRALAAIQFWFLVSFYGLQYGMRPRRALSVVRNLVRRREETVMEKFLVTKLRQLVTR